MEGMDKAKAPDKTPYKAWDNVKVCKEFFDQLITHPVFRREPKAINTAQYWLSAIDAVMAQNDDKPVACPCGRICVWRLGPEGD